LEENCFAEGAFARALCGLIQIFGRVVSPPTSS